MFKLSIITINYNNLEGLKRTVESVVNQTWQEFEYIVIDGGSTDGSTAYIESQSDTIDYWISEPDNGAYNAMNKGISVATGEYLLFLNSGDNLFNNEVLSKCNVNLNFNDLITFNIQIVGDEYSRIINYPDKIRFSYLFINVVCHQSTFIKKQLFEIVGLYDENLKIVSDWKFMILALFKYHFSYGKVNETLATYYLDGISSDLENREILNNERKQVLEEYFEAYLLDYELFAIANSNSHLLQTNRFKMLQEMEKTTLGRKIGSLFLRLYIVLFSKKKLKEVIG
jgi:glycosyltransferase involved in cell wall biosynthesis